jgi:hypothetical protein
MSASVFDRATAFTAQIHVPATIIARTPESSDTGNRVLYNRQMPLRPRQRLILVCPFPSSAVGLSPPGFTSLIVADFPALFRRIPREAFKPPWH